MNKALLSLLKHLMRKKYIGGKHIPEKKIINRKLAHKDDKEKKEFKKEYKKAINQEIIIRAKKMTGKNDGWHISLNPNKIKETHKMIQNETRD